MATLLYDITDKCNLRCKHCYNSDYFNNENADSCNIESVLGFSEKNNVSHVHILGGEPLLCEDLWRFIDGLPKLVTVSINTNGVLLDEMNIDNILSRDKINQITISIDGHDEESNSQIRGNTIFGKVIRNVSLLDGARNKRGSGLKLNLAFVTVPDNLTSLPELPFLSKEIGFDRIFISFLYYEGASKAHSEMRYDYETLTGNLQRLIAEADAYGIELLIDTKPAFIKFLEMTSALPGFRVNTLPPDACYANNGYYYISANNLLYPCGPSSKISEDFLLCDLEKDVYVPKDTKLIEPQESGEIYNICANCRFNAFCSPCPLNIRCGAQDLCTFAVLGIESELNAVKGKKILKSDGQIIKAHKNKLFAIDFLRNESIYLGNCGICREEDIYGLTISDMLATISNRDEEFEFLFNLKSAESKHILLLG